MENLTLSLDLYANLRIGIRLTCEDGEAYSVLSTNLVDAQIKDDEVCISSWNHHADLLSQILAKGQFEDTGEQRRTGYVEAPVWRVVCPDLLAQVARLRAHAKTART